MSLKNQYSSEFGINSVLSGFVDLEISWYRLCWTKSKMSNDINSERSRHRILTSASNTTRISIDGSVVFNGGVTIPMFFFSRVV